MKKAELARMEGSLGLVKRVKKVGTSSRRLSKLARINSVDPDRVIIRPESVKKATSYEVVHEALVGPEEKPPRARFIRDRCVLRFRCGDAAA